DGNALGSIRRFARSPFDVNDRPSVDVLVGGGRRFQRPSDYADRERIFLVRVYERLNCDAELEDLVEAVEAAVRADPTLGGLTVDIRVGDDAGVDVVNDEGWAAINGIGPMATIYFKARWEALEE